MQQTANFETATQKYAFPRQQSLRQETSISPPKGYLTSEEFERLSTEMIKRKFGKL
jgi:hypothetical protein